MTRVQCLECHCWVALDDTVIDQDGPPFRAYFHWHCREGHRLPFLFITEENGQRKTRVLWYVDAHTQSGFALLDATYILKRDHPDAVVIEGRRAKWEEAKEEYGAVIHVY